MKNYINSLMMISVVLILFICCDNNSKRFLKNTGWYFFDKDSSYFEVYFQDKVMIICENQVGNCNCFIYELINDTILIVDNKKEEKIIVKKYFGESSINNGKS